MGYGRWKGTAVSDIQDLIHSTMMTAYEKGESNAIDRCVKVLEGMISNCKCDDIFCGPESDDYILKQAIEIIRGGSSGG